MAECARYYRKSMEQLLAAGIDKPDDMFWAGVFVGICEQVMMKVKPAGMLASEVPHLEQIATVVAGVYGLHQVRLDGPASDKYEVWVCRKDAADVIDDLKRLKSGGLSWGEYHRLRGELCGYGDDMIRSYTEGSWP